MLTADTRTSDDVLDAVRKSRPTIARHRAWSEENRRLHEETVEALADAGVFRLRTPERYGGLESDTATIVEVGAEIAQADRAAAWVAGVYWIPTWMAAQFPDQVQDEVFATRDVRICGTLSPGGTAVPVDGGVVVDGRWGFISGAWHAHWQEIIAIRVGEDEQPYPVMALVPLSELTIVDDWRTDALRGTGSVSTVAEGLFVPEERVVPLPAVLEGQGASIANLDSAIYRNPLLPVASASSVGAVLGMARAAQAAFMERLPDRKITYTGYDSQREAPLTHLQVAEATMKLDEATFYAQRLARTVDVKGAEAAPWKLAERIQARADLGAVVRRAGECAAILGNASGASSMYQDVPIQPILRDLQAVNLHALMHPDTNDELYGRVLCGLEPNTTYI